MTDYFSNPPKGIDLSENRTSSNNAVGIVLFVIALVAVILRVIARLYFQHVRLGPDDYFMFGGFILTAGNLACCIAGGFYGLGKHIWVLNPYYMEKITIITFAYVFIYAWSVTLIKFSIILFYRRIFGSTLYRPFVWWCIFLTTGYLITNHVVLPLYCQPLPYYWKHWSDPTGGRCPVNEAKFYLGIGIINLIGDLSILLVPVPSVWKLQMPTGQKIAVYLIFLLGGFVCIASLIRIRTIVALTETTDISWAKSDVFIWSSVEPSVGIVSGCLPTLRPLFFGVLRRLGFEVNSEGLWRVPNGLSGIVTIGKKKTRGRVRALEDELEETRVEDEKEESQQPSWKRESLQQPHAGLKADDDGFYQTTVIEGKEGGSSVNTSELNEMEASMVTGGMGG